MNIFSNLVITSFIGTILGGAIGFYSSRLNNRLNAWRLAAANLHAVFQPTLFKILCQEIALGDEIRRESNNILATQILELTVRLILPRVREIVAEYFFCRHGNTNTHNEN
ncbi:MAG: hypothetical protein WC856_16340 [Methylococcaceae bacterium]